MFIDALGKLGILASVLLGIALGVFWLFLRPGRYKTAIQTGGVSTTTVTFAKISLAILVTIIVVFMGLVVSVNHREEVAYQKALEAKKAELVAMEAEAQLKHAKENAAEAEAISKQLELTEKMVEELRKQLKALPANEKVSKPRPSEASPDHAAADRPERPLRF